MKTDRELLELAAKAAGIFLTAETLKQALPKWKWDDSFDTYYVDGGLSGTVLCYNYSGEISGTTRQEWNPLTDDGDAMRLAVKLSMYLNIYMHPELQQTNVGAASHYLVTEGHSNDPYAATRRAIVRAAAAIGEASK